ncbi:kinase-like domain-containing protein [Mycena galericulata]|nr:kinase-like domain-containing protein [Mycena galericulata]
MMADHPGFPRVHGVWHDHDFYFIATDCGSECFVDLDVLSSFDQPRHMALLFAAQLILGLHALHKRGVAHLDVKPDNLLLSETNELLIIDYGVAGRFDVLDSFDPPSREDYPAWYTAKDAGSDTFPFLWPGPDNPHSVEVLQSGTPRYQSPPVKSGDPVSYGTDLWAVGMIMHQWLTGHVSVLVNSLIVLLTRP